MFDLSEYYEEYKNKGKKGRRLNFDKVLESINFSKGEHLGKLYSVIAYIVAKQLNYEMGSTQFRKFYDKVLELYEKSQRVSNDEEFKAEILPFVKLLYSKVQYSVERNVAGNNFKKVMIKSLDKVKTKTELANFKLFLEAIIGFMPKNKQKGKK